MGEPMITVSGMRGVVGESLSAEHVRRYSQAFASSLGPGPIVLGRDGRSNGVFLSEQVSEALREVGRDVLHAGIAATPTLGVVVRDSEAAGGIQVTASHNPPEYNGLKLFQASGRLPTDTRGEALLEIYHSDREWAAAQQRGSEATLDDPHQPHLQLLLNTVDVDAIRARGFRVVLDSNHGAGSLLGRRLLEQLGCELVLVGGEPDGAYEHPAEPTAANLVGLLPRVPAEGAEMGFCQDPDADRLAIIDEGGNYLGEELTLALCLDHVLAKKGGNVVVNCATSSCCQVLSERHASSLVRTRVGEAHVVEGMLAENAVFGGEGNGGPIDPRVGYVRDSFVGMVQVLDALACQQLPLSQLAAQIPIFQIQKQQVAMPRERLAGFLGQVERHFHDAHSSHLDGLRLDWPDRWLLVRGSNTEPIVRCIAEAASSEEAADLCEEVKQLAARGGSD